MILTILAKRFDPHVWILFSRTVLFSGKPCDKYRDWIRHDPSSSSKFKNSSPRLFISDVQVYLSCKMIQGGDIVRSSVMCNSSDGYT